MVKSEHIRQATSVASSEIGPLIAALNQFFPEPNVELDSAAVPNPFFGVAPKTFIDSNQTLLALVDGGSDGEVSPLQPMLVKARGIDTIFVIDAVRRFLTFYVPNLLTTYCA